VLLRSQGLGVACGLATVVLLALGSFVLSATRDGASAGVGMDDLKAFFAHPSLVHLWLYLLAPVLALYAVNTLLATWSAVARKLRRGVRSPSAYAPALIHVGFLLALLAHGVGGILGGERGAVVLAVDGGWQPLPGGRDARLLSLDVERLPGGMPKEVRARVQVRADRARPADERVVGYNRPLAFGGGAELHLLGDLGQVALAEISVAGETCRAIEGGRCVARAGEVRVLSVAPPGPQGPARVHVVAGGGPLVLVPGSDVPLPGGLPVRLESVRPTAGILLRSRSAPGNPLALAAALLVASGLTAMGRRFFGTRGQAQDGEEVAEAA
jgi:hypothetical protein